MKKPLTVAAAGIVALLALTGCTAEKPASSTDPTSTPAAVQPQTASPGTEPSPDAPPADGRTPAEGDWLTVAYEDSYKSVFTLTADQIELATGLVPGIDGVEDIGSALSREDLWQGDDRTAEHADLIVAAPATQGRGSDASISVSAAFLACTATCGSPEIAAVV
ncbi:hypothetical protein GCM10010922_24960 [Microbacterium sorbitolivorans]|uniref:Uncharacterized protein n=1 Tax=Microbacterium sorbitolivorans TaxID=1867410 RepID=A0A367Y2N2_9MICO|nr:hypothetical protein [Microbacterium sorbitolivorans]RCK60133.1 hypothetical protein DTO57_08375 [Microbacterium sorbitolivorans]GGF48082.1 hypothetical protein GCM10010922_24960 [Microbacterium sorbitolivorans]